MKRLVLALIVVAAFGTFLAPATPVLDSIAVTALGQQQDPSTITVYITRTGERYHRDGCRFLRQSRIATTLKEAVSRGYTPCQVCKPPTIR